MRLDIVHPVADKLQYAGKSRYSAKAFGEKENGEESFFWLTWALSSIGRARPWHGRGKGIVTPRVHKIRRSRLYTILI